MSETDRPATEPVEVVDPFEVELNLLARGRHADSYQILGPHWVEREGRPALAIRAFLPRATQVSVIWGTEPYPTTKIHPDGIFEAILPLEATREGSGSDVRPSSYRIRWTDGYGHVAETYDPFAFPPFLSDYDLHLSAEGTHYQQYEKFGAHIREMDGVRGVHFAAWGAQRTACKRGGRFRFLGRARSYHAKPRVNRHMGNVHAGNGRRTNV